MGQTLSVEAVKCSKNDGIVASIRNTCMNIINNGDWADYVDLQSKVIDAMVDLGIKVHTVVIENISFGNSNSIEFRSVNYDKYGDNYLVIKRVKTIFHYNFRIIIAW